MAKKYSLKTGKLNVECIPYGEKPWCVAYFGDNQYESITEEQQSWAAEILDEETRVVDCLVFLHERLLVRVEDYRDLIPMTHLANFEVTLIDEDVLTQIEEEKRREEKLPAVTMSLIPTIEAPGSTPSERWFNYQVTRLDEILEATRNELEADQREREERQENWEVSVVQALERERERIRPLTEFHIPKTGPQMGLFGETA